MSESLDRAAITWLAAQEQQETASLAAQQAERDALRGKVPDGELPRLRSDLPVIEHLRNAITNSLVMGQELAKLHVELEEVREGQHQASSRATTAEARLTVLRGRLARMVSELSDVSRDDSAAIAAASITTPPRQATVNNGRIETKPIGW